MNQLTLTLSPEMTEAITELASDINVTPEEAVVRIIRGCRSMLGVMLMSAPNDTVNDTVNDVVPVRKTRKSHYSVTINDVLFEASNNPELLIKVISYFTPKVVYTALVMAGRDTEIGAVVKVHHNNQPDSHRVLNKPDGSRWYIHMPTGYDSNRTKIKTICELLKATYQFED